MNDSNLIAQSVLELLKTSECIVVPNFGAFITSDKQANFNGHMSAFSPPQKEVCFNSSIQNHQGKLVKYIATKSGISEERAYERVSEFVATVQQQLGAGKRVELAGLGVLYLSDGKITLSGVISNHHIPQNFGLEPFRYPILKDSSSGRNLLPRAYFARLVLVVMLLGVGLSMPFLQRMVSPFKFVSTAGMAGIPVFSVSGSSSESPEPVLKEAVPEVGFSSVWPSNLQLVQETQSGAQACYYLVAGSFSNARRAVSFADILRSDLDVNTITIQSTDNVIRVCVCADPLEAEILQAYYQLREQTEMPFWVLQVVP